MRYPQLFATLAIEKKINKGINKGIIWHTQGSRKTALTYFNVKYLTDYFAKQGKIARFYFIVDRLDLLDQASKEFTARGLKVEKVNSKEGFIKNIQTIGEVGTTGELTITVVNIQKFSKDSRVKGFFTTSTYEWTKCPKGTVPNGHYVQKETSLLDIIKKLYKKIKFFHNFEKT